jgi:GNAT superfamily N-acetyltransferase
MQANASIRELKPGDVPSVGSLIRDTIVAGYRDVYPPRAVSFFLDYHSDAAIEKRAQNGAVLVAEQNGELVATGSLVGNEISGVFVKANLRGQGFGKQIMEELEKRAAKAGVEELTLSISLPSLGFYEKRGYKILAAPEIDVGMGQTLKYWQGTKRLKARQ